MEVVKIFNRKYGNLRGQLTQRDNALSEEITSNATELQAKLDLVVKLQEKIELLKKDYGQTFSIEDFEKTEISLAEIEYEM